MCAHRRVFTHARERERERETDTVLRAHDLFCSNRNMQTQAGGKGEDREGKGGEIGGERGGGETKSRRSVKAQSLRTQRACLYDC